MGVPRKNNLLIKILRWSERYVKTDMVYLVGQSGWLIIGQGMLFTLSFFLSWFFANLLTPEIYGTYKFAITVATLASLTTLTGMGTAIARGYAAKNNVHLPSIMRLKITSGALGAAATALFAAYYILQGDTTFALLFAVVAIWIPFFDSFGDYQFVLQGNEAFKRQVQYRVAQRMFVTLSTVLSIVLSGNVIVIACAYLGSLAISGAILWNMSVRIYSSPRLLEEQSKIHAYGVRLSLINMFTTSAAQADKVLLYHFLGPAHLAIYFFAVALPNEINGVLGNVTAVVFPRLVGKRSREFKFALLRKVALYILALTIPVGGYVLFAPWLFATFFPAYLDAIVFTQLFAGTLLLSPVALLTNYFLANKHERAVLVLTLVGPTVLLTSMVLLIPPLGIVGAIIALYTRLIIEWVLNLWFFLRPTPTQM